MERRFCEDICGMGDEVVEVDPMNTFEVRL